MSRRYQHEPGHRDQSDSPCPSDRLSRRLHRPATSAPPSMAQSFRILLTPLTYIHVGKSHGLQTGQAPRQAGTANPWPTTFKISGSIHQLGVPASPVVQHLPNSGKCCGVGLCQLTASSMKGRAMVPAWECGVSCPLSDHPYASPQGEVWAVPSNITRHYAKWPHARTSHVNAATSHNAALCVNGPEGMPPNPRRGLIRWLRVLSDPPPAPAVTWGSPNYVGLGGGGRLTEHAGSVAPCSSRQGYINGAKRRAALDGSALDACGVSMSSKSYWAVTSQ